MKLLNMELEALKGKLKILTKGKNKISINMDIQGP